MTVKTEIKLDPYKILGLDKNSTLDELKANYKLKANKLHPDKETGDIEQFKTLQNAYALLSDPKRRARYDATGEDSQFKDTSAEIRSQLAQIFLSVVNSKNKGNLVELVKDIINEKITSLKDQRKIFVEKQHLYEQKLNRVVKNSNGDNLFHGVISQQIKNTKMNIITVDKAVKIGDEMIIVLKDYEDIEPDVMSPNQDVFSTMTPGNGRFMNVVIRR